MRKLEKWKKDILDKKARTSDLKRRFPLETNISKKKNYLLKQKKPFFSSKKLNFRLLTSYQISLPSIKT